MLDLWKRTQFKKNILLILKTFVKIFDGVEKKEIPLHFS